MLKIFPIRSVFATNNSPECFSGLGSTPGSNEGISSDS